jgi:hypothetical protein
MTNQVTIKLPAVVMKGDTGVIFKIKVGGRMLGNLTVTQDSLIWHSAKMGRAAGATWQAFDEWMRVREWLKD